MGSTLRSIKELMDLSGRVALITGGAGHIGSVMADALAEVGCRVALLDSSAEACIAHAERVKARCGVDAMAHVLDIRDTTALRRVPQAVADQFGGLDILVNCAALVGASNRPGWISPFEEQSLDVWREALEVNLTAPFVLIQACYPLLARSGRGSIVNVGSIYGVVGPDWRLYDDTELGNPAAYGASKAALLQFTRWLATTLAPRIRVNAISPGGVYRDTPEPFHSRYIERTPLRRMATEEDFKGAIVYLASDLSAYVTGENLLVDGGWTAW